MSWSKEEMVDKIISLIEEGSSVNLGIGMPTLIAQRMPKNKNVMIQSENGVLGVDGRPKKEEVSPTLINAGKETISVKKGASFFDSALSFGMIRGGHIDYSILGGMEVDVKRNLANWMIPGKKITGMGGAMDLVNGSKNVIIMMTHFPLTGAEVVNLVITDHGIFKPNGKEFEVIELAPGVTDQQCQLP